MEEGKILKDETTENIVVNIMAEEEWRLWRSESIVTMFVMEEE